MGQNSNCQKLKKDIRKILIKYLKMRSRKENLPIYLDIPFKEILCKEQTSYIVIELIKSLLYQRQQIPQTIDTLRIELSRNEWKSEFTPPKEATPREVIRLRKVFTRKQKCKEKFIKKTQKFMENFQNVENLLKIVINGFDVQEISLSFGISAQCPKEVYMIRIPKQFRRDDIRKDMKKLRTLQIFRAVMGNEELFKRISTDISITNMFIGFKIDTKDKILPNGLLPKPEFTDEWSSRVKLTTFQISHPFQNEFIRQRHISKDPAIITGKDTYTPSAMEICTPYVNRGNNQISRKRSISGSSFNSDMIETPCQKSNCQNNKVDPALQIEFQKLKLENQKLWCYSQTALKGFRDPQIQSE